MKKEIKKGDKVKVLDTFEVYETYSEMFEKLGFKNTKKNIANENCCDVVWNVVEILKHPKHNIELAFIKTEVSELLIKVSAIELVESSNTYQLIKSQIIEIAENGSLVKELFPDVFEIELEVGKWYKSEIFPNFLFFNKQKTENGYSGYSIQNNEFIDDYPVMYLLDKLKPATPEEVETAFKNYFIEKGFVNGVKVKCLDVETVCKFNLEYKTTFDFDENSFYMGGVCLFKDGKFAETIQTPNDVIKLIEVHGTDKLLTFIEAYNEKN